MSDRLPSALTVWLLCAALAALFAAAFYPGLISFDSAYQWWQARSGEVSTINGVGIVLWWRAGRLLQDGPAPLLYANLVLFWCGVAWIAQAVTTSTPRRLLLPLLLAAAPASWLLAQIWSDLVLLALLVFATGALLRRRNGGGRVYLLAAGIALFLALTQRHNAVFALAPLLLLASGTDLAADRGQRWRRIGAAAAALLVLLGAAALLARSQVRVHYPVLPSLTLWDLAGMSVRQRQMLLPAYAVKPGASVDDLASAYVPWSNTPLFASPRAGVRYPFQPWPAQDLVQLQRDWIAAIATHPGAYLAHRGELLAGLFGTRARELPAELTYVRGPEQYRDNPATARNDSPLQRSWLELIERLRASLAFAAWPYLLAGLIAALHAWRRRDGGSAPALWLVLSAWCYALPYAVIAPAAEFRYLLWSCIASLIAVWLRVASMPPLQTIVADKSNNPNKNQSTNKLE